MRLSASRQAAQPAPAPRELGHEGDAVGLGPVGHHLGLRELVAVRQALEADRARDDAAVHLRAARSAWRCRAGAGPGCRPASRRGCRRSRSPAARGASPTSSVSARIACIAALPQRREGGGVEHQLHGMFTAQARARSKAERVLQRIERDGQRVQPFGLQRRGHRIEHRRCCPTAGASGRRPAPPPAPSRQPARRSSMPATVRPAPKPRRARAAPLAAGCAAAAAPRHGPGRGRRWRAGTARHWPRHPNACTATAAGSPPAAAVLRASRSSSSCRSPEKMASCCPLRRASSRSAAGRTTRPTRRPGGRRSRPVRAAAPRRRTGRATPAGAGTAGWPAEATDNRGRSRRARCGPRRAAPAWCPAELSTTMSPGVWSSRVTTLSSSTKRPGWVLSRCMAGRRANSDHRGERALQRLAQHRFVEIFADEDQLRALRLAIAPGAVEVVVEALTDTLHQQPHRLARDRDEALDAVDGVRARPVARARPIKRSRSTAGSSITSESNSS